MKIHITNTVVLNGGDAAILIAVRDLLREAFGPGTEFLVYDKAPEAAARYYPGLAFRPSLHAVAAGPSMSPLWRRAWGLGRMRAAAWLAGRGVSAAARLLLSRAEWQALSEYASADLIVSTGGTYLVEQYDLTSRLYDYEIARFMHVPVVFYTQSLGPFTRRRTRARLAAVFSRALAILVRDERSRRHIAELGIGTDHVHVCGDAAFALARNGFAAGAASGERPRIAVSVRHWPYFKRQGAEEGMARFRYALQALTHHLVEVIGADVTYISTCQGIPEYWTDDSKVATDIAAGLPEAIRRHVQVDRGFHPPQELLARFAEFDAVIATRMHAGILALAAGTPVLPIAYEFKTNELFERLGFADWVHDIEQMDAPALVQSADAFLRALPGLRPSVTDAVSRERASAQRSAAVVREAFERRQEACACR